MNCNQSYKYIQSEISEAEFADHIKGCDACAERIRLTNQTMAILDEMVEVPTNLTEKVLRRKSKMLVVPFIPSIDFNKYLQLAAVIATGIFLGILLGSHANSEMFLSKKIEKNKALIKYRNSHHLSDQSSIYKF